LPRRHPICIRPPRRDALCGCGNKEMGRAMSTFDEREKGFEQKYKHDQEVQFKVNARRNKLLGLWAAEQMGITGAAAEAYAKEVVQADFEKPGDSDVIAKVLKDLTAKGKATSEGQLRKQLDLLLAIAKEQIMKQS
jgi:hypothetical protein